MSVFSSHCDAHHEPLGSSSRVNGVMTENFFITLTQIGLTFAVMLLLYFGSASSFIRSPAMVSTDIENEATNLVRACDAFHALLDREPLMSKDRDLIEYNCIDLPSKLRSN